MLWIGASLVLVTFGLTWHSIHDRREALLGDLRTRLVQASNQQALAVGSALWNLNRNGTRIILRGIANDPDFLAVAVLDEVGRSFVDIGTTDASPSGFEQHSSPIVIVDNGKSRIIGTLALSFSLARLQRMQDEALLDAVFTGLLQLVAVLLTAAITLRAVIRPLEAITHRMLTVAGGDLDSPVPFNREPDQLGAIARAVELFAQTMAARRKATDELEQTQRNLESLVERRTHDLRESQERFRSLFLNSPLPMWVYSKESLRFLEVNDTATERYGYSRDEFLLKSLKDIRPAEDVERLTKWLDGRTPPAGEGRDWRHQHRDGRIVDVEIYSHDIQFGEPARLVVVIDVTARKKAQRQTQRIFETSQDVILVSDTSGTFIKASPSTEAALGYRPDEVVGRSQADFIDPIDLAVARDRMAPARQGEAIRAFRCRYLHRNGRAVPLVWMAVWSPQDLCLYQIGRDMTEHDRTEEQLRQAQKMDAVGQLTGGVAHDFNNILTVIMANAEAVADHNGLDAEAIERIEGIVGATERAASLTRQLLTFSRKQALKPERLNINDLVATTFKLLQRTLGEQIVVETKLIQNAWSVDIDRSQLESALINLSLNSRDAMPNGGRLTIETASHSVHPLDASQNADVSPGDYAVITVSDTGVGIPADIISKVFEPFFTTKEVGKGTGLGLSMVYGFVKQSGGHIRVSSEPGRGTSFSILLPKAVTAEQPAASSEPRRVRGAGERVLVVENDTDVRHRVVDLLRSLGYSVDEASDAAMGLAALEASPLPYNLLLSDVVMPGAMDGAGLGREVLRRWPGTRVMFMSGHTGSALASDSSLVDIVLLSKPFRREELAVTVQKVLARPGSTGTVCA